MTMLNVGERSPHIRGKKKLKYNFKIKVDFISFFLTFSCPRGTSFIGFSIKIIFCKKSGNAE